MSNKKSQCNQLITRLSNHPGFRGSSKWKQSGRNNENLRVLDSSSLTEGKSGELQQETEGTSSQPTIGKTFENELDEISESSLSVDDVSAENWEKISEGSFEHTNTDDEEYYSDLEILDEHIDDENKENEFNVEYRTCVPKYFKSYKAVNFFKPKLLILSSNRFSVCCISAVCSEATPNDCDKSAVQETVESIEPVAETTVSDMENKTKSPDLEKITCEKNDVAEMHSQSQSPAIVLSATRKSNDDEDVVIVFDSADTIVEENSESVSVADSTATCETKSVSIRNYECVADRPNLKICTPTCAVPSKSSGEISSGDQKALAAGEQKSSACLNITPEEVKKTKQCAKHTKSASEKIEIKSPLQKRRCYRSHDKKSGEMKRFLNNQRYRTNEQGTSENRSASPHRTSPVQNKDQVSLGQTKSDNEEKKYGERLDSSNENNLSKTLRSSEDTRVNVGSKNQNFCRENDSVGMLREKTNINKDGNKRENRGNSSSGNWQFLTAGSRKRKSMTRKVIDGNLPEETSTNERPAYKTGNNSRYSSKNQLNRGEIPFSEKSPDRGSVESFGSRLSSSRKGVDTFRNTKLLKKSQKDPGGSRTSYSGGSRLRNPDRFKKTESFNRGSRSTIRDRHSRERSQTRKRSPNNISNRDFRSRVPAHSVSKEARVFRRSASPKRRRGESPDSYRISKRRESPDSPRSSRRRESPGSYRNRRESPESYRNRRGSPESHRNRRESPDSRPRRASWSRHSGGNRSPNNRSKYSISPDRSRMTVAGKKLSRNFSRSPERFVQTAEKTSDAMRGKFMSHEHGFQQGYQVSQSGVPGFPPIQTSSQSLLLQGQNPMFIDRTVADGIKSSHGGYDSRMNSVTQMDTQLSENQGQSNFFPSVYPHLPVNQGAFNPLDPLYAANTGHTNLNENLFAGRYAPHNVPSVPGFNCPNPYAQASDLSKHQGDNSRFYLSGASSGVPTGEKSQDVFKNMQSVVNKLFGTTLAPQTETNNMKLSLSGFDAKSENYIGGGNPSMVHDFYSPSVTGAKSVLQPDSPHVTRVVQMRDTPSNSKFHGDSDMFSLMKNQAHETQKFEPYNFQGPSGNYQKTSLVQRLASVLTKLQMTDIPEYILSEMLVKIGAFNDSLPSHDISETQIVAVLRQFNYIR